MARRMSGTALGIASANVIALGALFAASGGTSFAARLIGTADIKDGAVTTGKLAEGAVSSTKIATGAVTGNRIAQGTITASKLARGAVDATALGRNAVTSTKVATAAIGARALAPSAVGNDELRKNAVTGSKIQDRTVTSLDLADKTIGRRHLSANALRVIWPNASRLDGISSTGFVRVAQNSAVWGERNPDIPVPQSESSIARIDTTALRGDMLVFVRMTIASTATSDDRGTVACRATYSGGRTSAFSLAGFQRYAGSGIQVGGNELVITDQHRFPAGPRNTIDVRCRSTVDNVVAKDISIMAVRVMQLSTAVVT